MTIVITCALCHHAIERETARFRKESRDYVCKGRCLPVYATGDARAIVERRLENEAREGA